MFDKIFEKLNLLFNNKKNYSIYFKSLNVEQKKYIINTFLKLYDEKYYKKEKVSNLLNYMFLYQRLFEEEEIYSSTLLEYINQPEFNGFVYELKNLYSNFFSIVKVNNKKDFLKLFNTCPSIELLIKNLNFDFNEQEKEKIKNVIKEKLLHISIANDLNQKIMFLKKIGFHISLMNFNFDINAKEEELRFFFENIHFIEDDELERIVLNNWFQVRFFTQGCHIDSFNMNSYIKLYSLRPEIIYSINRKIENSEFIYSGQQNLELIYNKINTVIMLGNF